MSARRRARQATLALVLGAALAGAAFAPAWAGGGAGGDDAKPEAFATIGKIYSESVEIKKKGADDFKAADVGDELKVGDTVRTDATGRVRIDYDDESFTRLDFDTTFKIKKLADEAGNRQVEGSLEDGNAWHRTAELTESESFEQTGAGATAAVIGTAFAIECDAPTHCLFVAVENGIRQEGTGGAFNPLQPFDICDATSGVLCDEVQTRTLEQMINDLWVQYNLWLDEFEFGLGPGPFGSVSGTLVVEDGVIVSFTPNPPGTTPPPVNLLDPNPIGCEFGCDQTAVFSAALPVDFEEGDSITLLAGSDITFVANLTVSPTGLYIVFTAIGDEAVGEVYICGDGCSLVDVGERYDADTEFVFQAEDPGTTSFAFHVEDESGNNLGSSGDVPVTVEDLCVFFECEEVVQASTAEPPPATEPDPPPAPVDEPTPEPEPPAE